MMTITRDIELAPYTTLRVGGHAKYFAKVRTLPELEEACIFSKRHNLAVFVLGEGSNVLISDKGFEGLVIKIELTGITFEDVSNDIVLAQVSAGENWDTFVEESVRRGLYEIENLSYIPGTVGATPIQNVGAYGVEVKDVISSVEVFDKESLTTKRLSNEECRFSYRNSVFKSKEGENLIVVNVSYRLRRTPSLKLKYKDVANELKERNLKSPTLREVRDIIGAIRRRKFPDTKKTGTAGSFFKNPILSEEKYHALEAKFPNMPAYRVRKGKMKVSLAWLLERTGWKGYRSGEVGVFENQPLVLVNFGRGSARELKALAEEIRRDMKKKTGIDIENEVAYIGS